MSKDPDPSASDNAKRLLGTILQHEMDHLNGTLYVDKMNSRSFINKDIYMKDWHKKPANDAERAFLI